MGIRQGQRRGNGGILGLGSTPDGRREPTAERLQAPAHPNGAESTRARQRLSVAICSRLWRLVNCLGTGLASIGCLRTSLLCAGLLWPSLPLAAQDARVDGHADFVPEPVAVRRCGPGWCYPQDGWLVVHIEGRPYDRGWQHGQLLAHQIATYVSVMAEVRSHKDPQTAWNDTRRLVDALFLRRYAAEDLEEMQGIADGAAAAGARSGDRRIDLLDIAVINAGGELAFLDDSLRATPRGLETQRFERPQYSVPRPRPSEHCSAFVATGPATADGRPVLGHITMSSLNEVRHFNVWLDIQPESGHRLVFQTSPGGIQSGLDYYLNSAGLVIAETTITQTHFDPQGQALASRIRQAVQYASSIDRAVELLADRSNGLYTNQWLLADINTNEIAMFELGTRNSRLWRSSREEWLGGTRGFYWGCNTPRSAEVLRETTPDLRGKPANLVVHPRTRDGAWVRLFERHRGKIGEAFGFEAFTTPPIAAFPSCDAKFTTADLARKLQSWGLFGPPLGRTWDPAPQDRHEYPAILPLISNDWTLLKVDRPPELEPTSPRPTVRGLENWEAASEPSRVPFDFDHPPAWHGTLLPKGEADTWLAAAFSEFEKVVSFELGLQAEAGDQPLRGSERDLLDLALFQHVASWRAAVHRHGSEVSLRDTRADTARHDWYDIATGQGVWLLHRLRERIGLPRLREVLDQFGTGRAGAAVSVAEFINHLRVELGAETADWFETCLSRDALGEDANREEFVHPWTIFSFEEQPERSLIVYGTRRDQAAQQEAAALLQREIGRRFSNATLTIKADHEVTEDELRSHHLLLIGRPASNSQTAAVADRLPVRWGDNSFRVRGETWIDPAAAVICAGTNPRNERFSVVVFAGLGAEATWHLVQHFDAQDDPPPQVLLGPAQGPFRKFRLRGGWPEEGPPQRGPEARPGQ